MSIAVFVIFKNSSKNMESNLNAHAKYTLNQKTNQIDKLYEDLEKLNKGIISNPIYTNFSENEDIKKHKQLFIELDRLLRSVENIFPNFENITLINQNNYIYHYNYAISSGINENDFYKADWYIEPSNYDNPVLTSLHKSKYNNDKNSNKNVFSFIYRDWDYKMENYSTIIIDVPHSAILDILNMDSNNHALKGTIVYDNNQILFQSNKRKSLFSYDNLVDSDSESTIKASSNELDYLIHKDKSSKTGWTIVEYFEESSFYQPVFDNKKIIFYTISASIILSIVISLLITKKISNPIYKLKRKMKEVEKGNFEERFITNSKDVIGDLADGFNHMLIKIKKLISQVAAEERLKKEAEMTALQLQINPHFLYNTLESINSLARKSKNHEISELIVLLGRLLRLSISSFSEMVPVKQEIDYVEYYLKIHQKKMRHPLNYNIVIDEKIKDIQILKWVLQPIVENAIIHGINQLEFCGTGQILIEGKIIENNIVFTILDNGIGIRTEKLKTIRYNLKHQASEITKYGQSIGLYNVQSRINLYYGKEYGITLESEANKETRIKVIIPYRSEDNAYNVDS